VINVGPVPLAIWVLLAVLIAGVGESMSMPAQQAVFVTLGRVVGMGSLMGLNNMGMSAGFLFGSLAGAGVVAAFGVRSVFIFAAIVMFLGMFLYVAIMRSARRELEHAAEVARLAEEREQRREAEQSRGEHGHAEAAV